MVGLGFGVQGLGFRVRSLSGQLFLAESVESTPIQPSGRKDKAEHGKASLTSAA